jgi:hypothetical protein
MTNVPDALISEILAVDALDLAEKITGKSCKDDKDTVALGFLMHVSATRHKQELLKEADDTCLSNETVNYLRIVQEEGFIRVLHENFMGNETMETFFVYWHPEGILLCFDTYGGVNINGGNFYYNWLPSGKIEDVPWRITSSGGYTEFDINGKCWVWIGHHDCREALRFHIRQLRQHGTFLNPWVKQPFLWLLSYGDTKQEGYSYEAITRSRIEKLPDYVQTAIGAFKEQ